MGEILGLIGGKSLYTTTQTNELFFPQQVEMLDKQQVHFQELGTTVIEAGYGFLGQLYKAYYEHLVALCEGHQPAPIPAHYVDFLELLLTVSARPPNARRAGPTPPILHLPLSRAVPSVAARVSAHRASR